MNLIKVLTYVLVFVLGAGCYYMYIRLKISKANADAKTIVEEANTKADNLIKEATLDAKTKAYEYKLEAEKEAKQQRLELTKFENKLLQREQNIDRRDISLQGKEDALEARSQQLNKKKAELEVKEEKLQHQIDEKVAELEKIAAMSAQEAKAELFKQVEQRMETEVTAYIKEQEDEAKTKASLFAKDIIANALNRYSQEEVIERTVSVVALPSEEMKGRIIGREGRNIKAIENATGVDLIIDDTPEVITLSCFDPIRREVARLSLETLIHDGRIQPGRIEEVVAKTKKDLDDTILKAGQDAVFELGLSKMNKELVMMIGKLKYQQLAKRAGLLHDLGKAVDHEMEGSHVELGAKFAKKFGENATVINAIESHHGDVPATSIIAVLISAADTLSAARPGSRSEKIENYIQRLEKLEELPKQFEGVDKVFAIQAGREIRVIVNPEKIDDLKAHKLARDVKEKIETELTYPGHIKVTVIREIRANEIAK